MILEIDNSTLEGVAACHTKVAMERIFNFRAPGGNHYLEAGKSLHKGLEAFFLGQPPEQAVKVFQEAYSDFNNSTGDLPDAYTIGNLSKVLEAFMKERPLETWPWKTQFVEVGFRLPFTDDVMLVGKIDQIALDSASQMSIPIDWKTTGRMDQTWEAKWRASSQFTQYMWAHAQIFQQRINMAYVVGIEIKAPPKSGNKCKVHGVPNNECWYMHLKTTILTVTRTQKQVQDWLYNVHALVNEYKWILQVLDGRLENVKKLPQQGTFNNHCYNCQFKDFCHLYDRRADIAQANYEVEKYDPLEGTRVLGVPRG